MNPLLYSSNEMFSSTELIRKSKMIFDKLLKSEVEKAIILRDGKPGFMLLEFEKYEELMKDYMALKEQLQSNEITQEEVKVQTQEVIVEDEIIESKEIAKEVDEPLVKESENEIELKEPKKVETSEEQFEHIEDDISEDDLKRALEDIENMSFNKNEKEPKEVKKDEGIEEFNFQDDFIDVLKQKKEQPLKEFWD